MLTSSQRTTVVSLQDYLNRIAHHIVRTDWTQASPDDVLQTMNLYIAERAEQDPTFLQQAPGYITKAAAWEARHWLRDTYTRYHRGRRIAASVPLETDDEDGCPADEVYAAPEPDRELAVDVREALSGLDKVSREIAQLKLAGWTHREIAQEYGWTAANVSNYVRKIKAALLPVWTAVGA